MDAPRNNPKALTDWYELDYFRRPRHPRTKFWAVLAAFAICGVAIATAFAWPSGNFVFQAGPLSAPHAFLANQCGACHTEAFTTARRLLPGNAAAHSTPDAACTKCHDAGAHSPHLPPPGNAASRALGCAGCHREHRGKSLTRLDDNLCTTCHANLATDDGKNRFQSSITLFESDHPQFGAWRGDLRDPGAVRFNHQLHLELADRLKDISDERLGSMADTLKVLKEQNCFYCHQPDADRRYLLPINFENHCASCHFLSAKPSAAPEGWDSRVSHPRRGETAAVVRGQLLERAWKLIAATQPLAGEPPERPPILQRGLPPLTADQKERARQLARLTEDRLYAADGGDVLLELERPLLQLRGGCAFCHRETGRRDGLPDYAPTRMRGRWDDVPFPHERYGPVQHEKRNDAEQSSRDRWFPFSRFGHEKHRMLECTACHGQALSSTQTSDVLMPTIADCRKCHNQSVIGVRSDCLECHIYHDRSVEPRGLRGTQTIEEVLGLKPKTK